MGSELIPPEITRSLEPRTLQDKNGVSFIVRSLGPDDEVSLVDFYEGFEPKRRAHGLPPAGRERVSAWLRGVLARGTHLVATRDRLIGHAFVVPTTREGVGEYAVFLHQDFRGRGVGTHLNRAMVDAARQAGLRRLWLTVEPRNRAAIRSYQKVGFGYLPQTRYSIEPEMELEIG